MLSRLLGGLLLAAVAAILLVSPRGWSVTSMPRVEDIAALPAAATLAGLRERDAVILPYLPSERGPVAAQTARLGYSYREFSIFRMPLWAQPDMGLVTFVAMPAGYSAVPVSTDEIAAIDAAAGRPVASGYRFHSYRHAWGLLIVALFAGWLAARGRDIRRRELDPD